MCYHPCCLLSLKKEMISGIYRNIKTWTWLGTQHHIWHLRIFELTILL
jgi:hypothetical protein